MADFHNQLSFDCHQKMHLYEPVILGCCCCRHHSLRFYFSVIVDGTRSRRDFFRDKRRKVTSHQIVTIAFHISPPPTPPYDVLRWCGWGRCSGNNWRWMQSSGRSTTADIVSFYRNTTIKEQLNWKWEGKNQSSLLTIQANKYLP